MSATTKKLEILAILLKPICRSNMHHYYFLSYISKRFINILREKKYYLSLKINLK